MISLPHSRFSLVKPIGMAMLERAAIFTVGTGSSFGARIAGRSSHAAVASSSLHFYRNRQLELWAAKTPKLLSLRQLVFYGRSMNTERLVKSANYVRTELPIRLAHRIRDMQALPYIVVTQEWVKKSYELYWVAFEKLRHYPVINDLEDNDEFCLFLKDILNEHAPVIPWLALGLSLSSHHIPPDELDAFFQRMMVSRISRRVIAEHHLALSDTLAGRHPDGPDGHVGIIYSNLNLKTMIGNAVDLLKERPGGVADASEHDASCEPLRREYRDKWPKVIVDGHPDVTLSYIKEHLEYILFELLKNSMRYSILFHAHERERPVIRATIVSGRDSIIIRISDQGGGVSPDLKSTTDLFSFSHLRNSTRLATDRIYALESEGSIPRGFKGTVAEQFPARLSGEGGGTQSEPVARRVGLGLPLSNIFARYFGGSLDIVSLEGWGLDVYLRLPRLGTRLEGIEV